MRPQTSTALVALLALVLVLSPAAPAALAQGGVWLSVDRGRGATYAIGDPITISFTLPQPRVQVANPSAVASATVRGADAVYVHDPAAGRYNGSLTLSPGAGGWAIRVTGGPIAVAVQ
jgi:hypothetical protein